MRLAKEDGSDSKMGSTRKERQARKEVKKEAQIPDLLHVLLSHIDFFSTFFGSFTVVLRGPSCGWLLSYRSELQTGLWCCSYCSCRSYQLRKNLVKKRLGRKSKERFGHIHIKLNNLIYTKRYQRERL